jgi:DNA polymerase III sliding clamp (beta) subunit (PCNA family)
MKTEISVDVKELNGLMENAKLAINKRHHVMDKIKIKVDQNKMQAFSLDGYRLHTKIIEIHNSSEDVEILTDYVKVPKSKICVITIDTESNLITYDFVDINEKIIKPIYKDLNFPEVEDLKDQNEIKYTISCNPKFLIEALKGFKGENVTIEFSDNNKPFIVTSMHEEDESYNLVLPVIMPR